jgi:hypothetical protein
MRLYPVQSVSRLTILVRLITGISGRLRSSCAQGSSADRSVGDCGDRLTAEVVGSPAEVRGIARTGGFTTVIPPVNVSRHAAPRAWRSRPSGRPSDQHGAVAILVELPTAKELPAIAHAQVGSQRGSCTSEM